MRWPWSKSEETEIRVVVTSATELKPGAKYLIALNNRAVTAEDAQKLMSKLRAMGVKNSVALMTHGDPSESIQIIEQEEKHG